MIVYSERSNLFKVCNKNKFDICEKVFIELRPRFSIQGFIWILFKKGVEKENIFIANYG
jgi:hypothetical protein